MRVLEIFEQHQIPRETRQAVVAALSPASRASVELRSTA
jgi:hypothetical protein